MNPQELPTFSLWLAEHNPDLGALLETDPAVRAGALLGWPRRFSASEVQEAMTDIAVKIVPAASTKTMPELRAQLSPEAFDLLYPMFDAIREHVMGEESLRVYAQRTEAEITPALLSLGLAEVERAWVDLMVILLSKNVLPEQHGHLPFYQKTAKATFEKATTSLLNEVFWAHDKAYQEQWKERTKRRQALNRERDALEVLNAAFDDSTTLLQALESLEERRWFKPKSGKVAYYVTGVLRGDRQWFSITGKEAQAIKESSYAYLISDEVEVGGTRFIRRGSKYLGSLGQVVSTGPYLWYSRDGTERREPNHSRVVVAGDLSRLESKFIRIDGDFYKILPVVETP